MNKQPINEKNVYIPQEDDVRVTLAGRTLEFDWYKQPLWGRKSPIERIDDDLYVVRSTGEVKEFQKSDVRTVESGIKAANMVRNLIRANATPEHSIFATLHYSPEKSPERDQMPDDLEKIITKIRRKMKTRMEYIAAPEMRDDLTWHYHLCLDFPDVDYPKIPIDWLKQAWSNGGYWLTRITPKYPLELLANYMTKGMRDVDTIALYPQEKNLYSASKGLVRPRTTIMTKADFDDLIKEYHAIPGSYTKTERTVSADGYMNLHQRKTYEIQDVEQLYKDLAESEFIPEADNIT